MVGTRARHYCFVRFVQPANCIGETFVTCCEKMEKAALLKLYALLLV